MRRFTPPAMLACLFLLGSVAAVRADDAAELKEKAQMLLKQSAVAAEDGRMDEARKLKMQAAELLKKAGAVAAPDKVVKDKPLPDKVKKDKVLPDKVFKDKVKIDGGGEGSSDVYRLQDMLKKLSEKAEKIKESGGSPEALAEIRELHAATEKKLQYVLERGEGKSKPHGDFHAEGDKLKVAMQRVEHFQAAAKHLIAAGAEDLAHQLMQRAKALEVEVMEAKKAMSAAQSNKDRGGADQSELVGDLRAEIERLRAEVKELRQMGEKREKKERRDKDPGADA